MVGKWFQRAHGFSNCRPQCAHTTLSQYMAKSIPLWSGAENDWSEKKKELKFVFSYNHVRPETICQPCRLVNLQKTICQIRDTLMRHDCLSSEHCWLMKGIISIYFDFCNHLDPDGIYLLFPSPTGIDLPVWIQVINCTDEQEFNF